MRRTEDYRRHQTEKRKRRVMSREKNLHAWGWLRYGPMYRVGKYYAHGPCIGYEWPSRKWVGKVTATPHPCSRYCCGHRRYWEGPTVQERRQEAWNENTNP